MDKIINQCHPPVEFINNETIVIFGGSGSLGTKIIRRWIKDCKIINISRDEEKQWLLKSSVQGHQNLDQYIGDISNYKDVEDVLLLYKPSIVIIAACLKHIEICEKFPQKSVQMNFQGLLNVQSAVERVLHKPHTVLFVSTDKACNPITTYGYTKSLSESLILNYNGTCDTRYIGIRYGNVLNSSGSIIQYLTNNKNIPGPYTLTHPDMTRFLMTLDQSVNLIEYALQNANRNEIIVPYLYSMKIKELFELFSVKFSKDIITTGLRCKEKIHEDLISEAEAPYCCENDGYIHISKTIKKDGLVKKLDSSMTNVSLEELKEFLTLVTML
jgi:FlaA1/EpsC-like NDP-sugar epimerase